MMRKKTIFILLLIISIGLKGQVHTTMGTDFWVSYLYFTYDYYAPQYSVTLHAFASGPRTCSVTMTNPNTGWSSSFYIIPGMVTNVSIPFNTGCTSASGSITPTALHVTATDTISLYLIMLGHNNLDITNALPTESLGSDYMVQCYPSKPGTDYRSEIVIVATEDSTVVDINLTAPTMNGFSSGSTHTVTLNQGDAYQLRGATNVSDADLTGTTITAHDCKKIAVYSGHFCAYVPHSMGTPSCDHIFDQCMPTNYWGRQFVVAGTRTLFDDHVRVMPLENNCQIYKDGIWVQTLNAGQIYDFTLSSSNSTAFLETTTPACVYLFMGSAGDYDGDPSMVVINPIEQMVENITFGTYSTTYTNTHYVNIVTEASESSNIRLDNNPVTFHNVPGNSQYQTARLSLNQGSHTIKTLGNKGFLAYAFGIGSHESYGYSVGSCMNFVPSAVLSVNGNPYTEGDTVHICSGYPCIFSVSSHYNIDSCTWTVNGQTYDNQTTLHLNTADTGLRRIHVRVVFSEESTCQEVSAIKEYDAIVRVFPTFTVYDSDTIGLSSLPWTYAGRVYNDSVHDDRIGLFTRDGCDSVIFYTLIVYDDTIREHFYDSVCAGTEYHNYGFFLSPNETREVGEFVYRRTDTTYVAYLHLTQLNPPTIVLTSEFENDNCYLITALTDATFVNWTSDPTDPTLTGQENNLSIRVCPQQKTIYTITASYKNLNECSNNSSIALDYRSPEAKESLWIPNVFTPEMSSNNQFMAIGVGIHDFEMFIFNKWGQKIFHSHNIDDAWDGTFHNKKCPIGTYTYLIYYHSIYYPNEIQKRVGTVTLIR